MKSRIKLILAVMIPLGVAVFVSAFLFGSSGISLPELIALLRGDAQQSTYTIFFNLRLPRVIICFVSGGALAICGACLQGMFKNPMADSYVIGVSAGSALGASLALAFSSYLSFFGYGAVSLFSFFGAILAVAVVYRLAKVYGRISVTSLLLSGIAVSTLCTAFVYCLMILFRDRMEHIIMWTMGSFSSSSWDKAVIVVPVMLISSLLCLPCSRSLNIMLLGDEDARHLGVNSNNVRRILILLTTIAASAAVSASGIIGFVGLIVPHMLRLISGPDHKRLLPLSFLGGGIFLLAADTVARVLMEIPIGVVTAFIGVPFFLFLLRRGKGAVK
ncbi:MAG: iron chelate uptake ABC transporter family permease subunit [Christensenellales bacterium]